MSNDLLIVQFVKNGGSGSKILKTDLRQVSGIKPVKTYLKDFSQMIFKEIVMTTKWLTVKWNIICFVLRLWSHLPPSLRYQRKIKYSLS